MRHPISKSSLTASQVRLIELLQRLNFGRIDQLHFRDGQPVFDPAPRVIQKLKMGGDNAPRPESGLDDFWLKQPTVDLFQAMADLGDGIVLTIEVKHGLPFTLEIERTITPGGDHA